MKTEADELVEAARQAKREGRLADAKQSILDAIVLLREKPPSLALGGALRELGEVERAISGSGAGAAPYEEAVAILRSQSVPLKLAHTIRHLGDIYRHSGDLDRSAGCYEEALDLYRGQAGESRRLDFANALRGAVLLQEKIGQRGRAIELWQEARAIYAEENLEAAVEEAARHIERQS
jgi:tetratricopeptide (TPR) repeat protein